MKMMLLSVLVLAPTAWLAASQSPTPKPDEGPKYEFRFGATPIDTKTQPRKVAEVHFDTPMKRLPIVTATVVSLRKDSDYLGVYALSIKDVTPEGFRYFVQETYSGLRSGEKLELNWIAIVQEN